MLIIQTDLLSNTLKLQYGFEHRAELRMCHYIYSFRSRYINFIMLGVMLAHPALSRRYRCPIQTLLK